jgi:hypothetical protein
VCGLPRPTSWGAESNCRVGSLESGALLCGGYKAYREPHSPAAISFEHAWFLLLALGPDRTHLIRQLAAAPHIFLLSARAND